MTSYFATTRFAKHTLPAFLAFQALSFGLAAPTEAISQGLSVELQLNGSSDLSDDYLCWSPRPARARLLGTTTSDVEVVISSEPLSVASTGAAQFQADDGSTINVNNFAASDTLTLTLPRDGGWVPFHVAGKEASTGQKDLVIVARDATDNQSLGSVQAMVRVRKDVRTLSPLERQKFLVAVRALHDAGDFEKYHRVHEAAFDEDIHGLFEDPYPPLFLAWHRAFLLNFERDLQAIDADVALPYWKFDEVSFLPGEGSVFSADFLGEHDPLTNIVRFNDDTTVTPNPWHNFRTSVSTRPLSRQQHPDRQDFFTGNLSGPIPANRLQSIIDEHDTHVDAGGDLELGYHNGAHGQVLGWLGQRYSPADPLFFLLHANVDRGFAHWQEADDTWDHTGAEAASYHATGAHPGPGADYLKGSYALDEMWPWNPSQPDWPSGMFFQMPQGVNGPDSAPVPTPASQIDYLSLSGKVVASGACYDDIGYVR